MSTAPKTPLILCIAALVLITAHTQLTLRQLGLRVTGIREGEIHKVYSLEDYYESTPRFDRNRIALTKAITTDQVAVLQDAYGTFLPGELIGKRLFFQYSNYEILDNTATHILVSCGDISEIDEDLLHSDNYQTGFTENNLLITLATSVPAINLTLSDLVLALLAMALIYYQLRSKSPLSTFKPRASALAFLFAGCVSLVPALRIMDSSMVEPQIRKGIIELAQFIEVMIVGLWCFEHVLRDQENRRYFHGLVVTMTGIVVLMGLIEYVSVFSDWTLRGLLDVEAIDSIFGFRFNSPRAWSPGSESNRNILACYLCMTFPFILAYIRTAPKRWVKGVSAIIAVGSLCLVMHAAFLVTMVVVGALSVYLIGRRKALVMYAASTFTVLTLICVINTHHGRVLIDSVAFVRTTDTYGLLPMPLKGTSVEGTSAVQQKYLELQASLNAVSFSPFMGIGIGNYQAAINDFYANAKVEGLALEKDPVNLMERNSHSLYQVVLVETGVFGLGCLLMFLAVPLVRSCRSVGADPDNRTATIAVIAALTAIIVCGLFGSFMVRGVQLIAVAIIGYAYALSMGQEESS